MIGTSGGGFDLMTEALSLTGQAEVPLVIYLAQRVGPGTGSATYTEQSDLHMARHAGHGEFPRLVVAAGDPVEAAELTSQAFYFSQKYKIPALVLSDKHLAESIYSIQKEPVIMVSEKSNGMKKYSSYEHDANGIEMDKAELIKANVEKRNIKREEIEKEAEKLAMFKVYGNEKSNNLVLFWGSTKGAVLDAIADLNVKAIQVLYIEPFSNKIKAELQKAKRILVVENNATSQLSSLIAEKTGIMIDDKNKILRYDGRPFVSDELAGEIKRRMK
jgi:2-oxoglutarate ferredoxin oxidoreductase subunit alpha